MNTHWPGPADLDTAFFKVVVHIERRDDGGLRAWSEQVPGLVLSHASSQHVLDDVKPALEVLLSDRLGRRFIADRLDDLRSFLASRETEHAEAETYPRVVEYVAHAA